MDFKSDRRKYNPNDKNEYTSPREKPPRYDLRKKHKIQDDPLDNLDKKLDDKLSTTEEIALQEVINKDEKMDEFKLAKKITKEKIKTAGEVKHIKDTSGFDVHRSNIEGFQFKEEGMKSIAKTYKHMATAFYHMAKASHLFNQCKSSQISPDGKLGGMGYVQPIKAIRHGMAETVNVMSELIDTFYDEVNSPYWKTKTLADHPAVKEILNDADKILNDAEEVEDEKPQITKE